MPDINQLTFTAGPKSAKWPSVKAVAAKNPTTGYNCGLGIPGGAACHALAKIDPRWSKSHLYFNYSHATGRGSVAVTVGDYRYTRPLTTDEQNFIVLFDARMLNDIKPTAVVINLDDSRYTDGTDGWSRKLKNLNIPQPAGQPQGNSTNKRATNRAWSKRERTRKALISQIETTG